MKDGGEDTGFRGTLLLLSRAWLIGFCLILREVRLFSFALDIRLTPSGSVLRGRLFGRQLALFGVWYKCRRRDMFVVVMYREWGVAFVRRWNGRLSGLC